MSIAGTFIQLQTNACRLSPDGIGDEAYPDATIASGLFDF